jgi:hypothetical protein
MAKHTKHIGNVTSFHGVVLSATPQELVNLFPDSFNEQNDGSDKVNFDFTLETESGDVFTIYDWKEYRSLKMNELIQWHIGGYDEQTCLQGKAEVLELLNK